MSASRSHCAHTYGSTPLPIPHLPSPSSLHYVDLRLCSSPTVTRATYEYDTSLLNGYQTARSKKELSKFSVSNCQERGKEAVREEVREEGETYAHWMHTTATCFLSLNTTLQSGLCEGGGRREKGEKGEKREGGRERKGEERGEGEEEGGGERRGKRRGEREGETAEC